MARGNCTVVSGDAQGKFKGGYISGTPTPGVVVQPTNAALKLGRPTYQVWQKASGAIGEIAVLLGKTKSGGLEVGNTAAFTGGPPVPGDAYATGEYCEVYISTAGDELNLVVHDVAGTADDVAIGDLFGVETLTGKLIANSSFAYPCFIAREAVTDPTADYVLWVEYIG